MADKTIGSLPAATTVDDSSLWVAENQGQAQKVTGAQIKGFAQESVQQYVSQAQQAAQEALEAVSQIGTAVDDTKANAQAAQAAQTSAESARQAIENMMVEAITLATGQPATVSKSLVDQVVKLTFGLPTGAKGDPGNKGDTGTGIQSIELTSGTHAPGTTDTYTITLSDDSTFQFTVYNGANGTGAGDFMADGSVPMTGNLDMNGNRVTEVGPPTADTDAANKGYVDEAVSNMEITTDTTPTQGSTNPVQSGGVYTALSKKQDNITGQQGQVVGFDAEGKPVAQAAPDTGVTSFNGRKGAVSPGADDYSASMIKFTDGQTFQQKYDAGQLTGPAGKDGTIGPAGPSGNNATINGVNALTIQSQGGIQGSQSGSTYTIDGSALVQTVNGATAGNVPTLTAEGQLQDSGKSLDDLGNNDFVVTITGSSAEGPFTADQQYADIMAAIAAGKNVFASWDAGSKKYPCIPLTVSPGSSNPSGTLAFTTFDLSYGVGPVAFTISSANAVTGFIQSQHTHTSANITDTIPVAKGGTGVTSLTGTDYTAIRVRGMALMTSAPDTIPNGCLVGVYE